MVNLWVGWNFKSELVWCNKEGTMKGEKTFLREFFKELENDGGDCLDEYHDDGEACMNCEACYAARDSILLTKLSTRLSLGWLTRVVDRGATMVLKIKFGWMERPCNGPLNL